MSKTLSLMVPLDLVRLTALMELTDGLPQVAIGLVDGFVFVNHPDIEQANIRDISETSSNQCSQNATSACVHGTFVAGILSANRNSVAPSICPNCTLLIRPIFGDTRESHTEPSATAAELSQAIIDCIKAGANCINLSLALAKPSSNSEHELTQALDYAAKRGVLVVAAAGNQGTLGSTAITRHPCVIPVVACDLQGKPIGMSNLGNSISRRGLMAPGESITSLGITGKPLTSGGTSAATPFVTGAISLLWSLFPKATAYEIRFAITEAHRRRRTSVVPPLLDAWGAYQYLITQN